MLHMDCIQLAPIATVLAYLIQIRLLLLSFLANLRVGWIGWLWVVVDKE